MIDLLKNVFWYIIEGACVMVNILKYVPGVQWVDEAVNIRPCYLRFALDKAVRRRPWKHFSDGLKDQGICEWLACKTPRTLEYVPDHFKTREMCSDVVIEDPLLLRYVPDWFVTQQHLR